MTVFLLYSYLPSFCTGTLCPHGGSFKWHQDRWMYNCDPAAGHFSSWNGMGSQSENGAMRHVCTESPVKLIQSNVPFCSPQAQLVLLVILLVAIVNVFVGTAIPATLDQKSKGIFNYNCKCHLKGVSLQKVKNHPHTQWPLFLFQSQSLFREL